MSDFQGTKETRDGGFGQSRCSTLRNWWSAFWAWRRDPFRVERDWTEFASMSDDELRTEFDSHLDNGTGGSNRFRHLCQFISVRWIRNA
jgi:hypothetical protein